MNLRQTVAINIMKADTRRKLYRGAYSWNYYLTYTKGIEPLTKADIDELLLQNIIRKDVPELERYELFS